MVTMRSCSEMKLGQHVEQRRLAGAGAAADQAIEPRPHAMGEKVEHRLRERFQRDKVFGLEPLRRKPPDRQQRAINGQRRDDRVDARAVWQASVDHRRALVDSSSDPAHDAIDHAQQLPIVLECRRYALEDAASLDEHVFVSVHEDVAHRRVPQQGLERPEAEYVVEHLREQRLSL